MGKILKFETKEQRAKRLNPPTVKDDPPDPLTAALREIRAEYSPKEWDDMFDELDDLDDVEGYVVEDEVDRDE